LIELGEFVLAAAGEHAVNLARQIRMMEVRLDCIARIWAITRTGKGVRDMQAAQGRLFAPYLWMITGCFCTASMGQFAHLLRQTCDWRVIALTRASVAFFLALALARACSAKLVLWRPAALWLRGCASSISLLCTFYALAQISTAEVMTLTNTFPIWVAFLSWPLLRMRPTLSVWLSAACGVMGVALIQSPHFGSSALATSAVALSLTAALTNAIAMLGLHRLKGVHAWAIVVHYSGVATLFVLGSWVVGSAPDLTPLQEPRTLLLLLGVGVAATLGQVCVTKAFTAGPPARVSVVGLTQIIFALLLDLIFEGPPASPALTLTGIALVLAPTAWVMAGRAAAAEVEEPSLPLAPAPEPAIRAPHRVAPVEAGLPASGRH
jgi:drug/metabolite transporter (DMT)-like permease